MSSNHTLSICIGTLNRASFLKETLESIGRQAKPDEVEIVIVDGASTDDTEQTVRRFEASWGVVRYVRREKNYGVDRDYDQAVEAASGKYCWLLSDDDPLKPGAIAKVLQRCREGHDLIIANGESRTVDLSGVLEERRLEITTDQIYTAAECDKLLTDVGWFLSYIGCIIVKRSLWRSRERGPYFDSLFIHVGVILQAPLEGTACVVAEPLITIRQGNSATWNARSFEVWMVKWPALVWSFPHIADSTKTAITRRFPWSSPKPLLIFRARGEYSVKEYKTWVEPNCPNLGYRFIARLIAKAPQTILYHVASMYLDQVVKIQPRYTMPLYELRHLREIRYGRFSTREQKLGRVASFEAHR